MAWFRVAGSIDGGVLGVGAAGVGDAFRQGKPKKAHERDHLSGTPRGATSFTALSALRTRALFSCKKFRRARNREGGQKAENSEQGR
jgi:hypothetical protein